MTRVVVGGDICPMNRHCEPLRAGGVDRLLAGIRPYLAAANLRVFNLECPLIEGPHPIAKAGPVLSAPQACVRGLRELGADILGLANNHIMDHGLEGLRTTLAAIEGAGLKAFGAGENLEQAGRIRVVGERPRIGFLGLAGREFSIAGERTPGCQPADPVSAERAVRRARGQCDALVVLLHEGQNLFRYPSPELRRKCRWLTELGAAVVVCQHSHCVGSIETAGASLIVYGQGNFLFDWMPDPGRDWNEAVLLGIDFDARGVAGFDVLPFARDPGSGRLVVMEGEARRRFLAELECRGHETANDEALAVRWREFCAGREEAYAGLLSNRRRYARLRRVLRQRLGIGWSPWSPNHRRILGNLIRCDDHREALETIFLGMSVPNGEGDGCEADSGDERKAAT